MAPKRKRKVSHTTNSKKQKPRAKNDKHKSEAQPEISPLLKLAAELRNTIYDYSLVDGVAIDVTPTMRLPGLLQTCRQLRDEATSIWLLQNTFFATVIDCDNTLMEKFEAMSRVTRQSSRGGLTVGMTVDGRADRPWPGLLRWCKFVYDTGTTFVTPQDDMNAYERVIAGAHAIAKRCRDRGRDWGECQEMLEDLKFAVKW